jgi:predicted nucleic acid-binding protein
MTTAASSYLLDTNVIFELRRNKPHGAIVAWLKTIPAPRLFVSAFSVAELQAGVENLRDRDGAKADEIDAWIDAVCQTWAVLPLDADCCRQWAREMKGRSDALFEDAFLVATARIHGLTIVTRNAKDFALFDIPILNPFLYRGA